MDKKALVIRELAYLMGSSFFQTKPVQRKFLRHFHLAYKKAGEIVSVRTDDLLVLYGSDEEKDETDNDGDQYLHKKNWVSHQIVVLRKNLQEFYKGPGRGRSDGIVIPKLDNGNYVIELQSRQKKKIARERPSKEMRGDIVALKEEESGPTALRPLSVNETIVLALKGVDAKRLVQIQRVATGTMWGSLLIGLSVLIVLLIGFPYWPSMPFKGFFLAGVLIVSVCTAVLARPITRLSDIPFRRWWGNTFCLYRGHALVLARYSGRCVVDGCQGELAIVQEAQERATFFHMRQRRWLIVCKNVPTEHPRTPFDFTALDRVRASSGSVKSELPRTA